MPLVRHIVIKPTLACTAKCPTCALRRQLHTDLKGGSTLSLDQWQEIFKEANSLGASYLTISGGEPTLYEYLPELIRAGKSYSWQVRVNSNGSLITREYARCLLDAGLDIMCISLYAASNDKMTAMRGNPTLWQKATNAISIFAKLEADYPHFEIISQTILSRNNYSDFPALLELHAGLGSRSITVSYLEGDFEKKYLLGMEEIKRFREQVIPQALLFCNSQKSFSRLVARLNVKRIFSPSMLSLSDWASGHYWRRERSCRVPSNQILILANGDVHPCNIIEYCHNPVAGNLFEQSLTDIWNGEIWRNYRICLHEKCYLCPINRHIRIQLRPKNMISALYSVIFYDMALSHKAYWLISLWSVIRKRMLHMNQ
jgi:radical SAM protein with 4Fe4S-binding SPASM domain